MTTSALDMKTLVSLSPAGLEELGVTHTAREIAHQPACWNRIANLVVEKRAHLQELLLKAGVPGNPAAKVILSGAGTSEYIGRCVEGALREALGCEVDTRASTDCVTHLDSLMVHGRDYLVVHFARSGNSPETMAMYRMMKARMPQSSHLAITCNAQGALAQAAETDSSSMALILPPETNDRGLAMTSSFTGMMIAALGLAHLQRLDEFVKTVAAAGIAVNTLMENSAVVSQIAARPWNRVAFLGSGPLLGCAREAALKMTELTDGRIATWSDSFLAFRHGPKVFLTPQTLLVCFVSSDERVWQYERDLIAELVSEAKHGSMLTVSAKPAVDSLASDSVHVRWQVGSGTLPDSFRPACDIVVGQLLAMFKSLNLGLRPDSPNASGVINRVVSGVRIYEA
ncbi:MAG: SIS domain-containing protein [Candidatus Sumerlaeaceae bacterium]